MVVNRSTTPHIPKKSYLAISPATVRESFHGLPPELAGQIADGLSTLFNKFSVDERLNYDIIEKNLGGYTPLQPWGYVGDSLISPAVWFGVYQDEESASAETGPVIDFGLNPTDRTGFFLAHDATLADASGGTAELVVDATTGALRLDFLGGGQATLIADGNDGRLALASDQTLSEITVEANVNLSKMVLTSQSAGIQLQTEGNDDESFVDVASSGASISLVAEPTRSYLFLQECTADPTQPSADLAKLFIKDNGAGKTQLCIRYSSGGTQVLHTQP